ncbi:50S ribosomal protein L1 [Dehalococcoides mccartyi]|jgi:large subunit ribosomal protein L1|uniref:Large ribosomal subunit protein uL1 n=2 Tax=Dehalococcoides mccartyi TaxID=61435 RepID=RL1_DEHMB|nr:50S ribosomal protein L1 [Dehalococcoides mccartyi]A5FQR1.1 RecName: Full=Large ribosomal subunit protein uL1; AltName: Full=50S ribosomal protein L1 [Dehalococcoides mccartyi BAV1]AGG08026.1 50S ribosomal protein L1 [Dehalococcoides mccartyi BTF08]AQX74722.1 50S ribosomal protein L1 [Dehalococcoides mccartyi]AQY73299.1 50S ribosomal protein L1 [Dehalococcoides mccartyi]KSV17463.1 50S ribosomal protein L1 [Dehalococcoides mccartyi]OBW63467.1 MAG: 50S ribosomal protein L1 [Dehalococcoides m
MVTHGKKYQDAIKLLDQSAAYAPAEAIDLAKKMSAAKFDETVEMHLKMGLDPKNATQQLRGVAVLPHGLGKTVRVLVFAQGEAEKAAQVAGADVYGGDELIKKIEAGFLDFDVAISTPDMMSKVGKLGKVLGRRGLMPNPKSGTVVPAEDFKKVIEEARKGRVEFKLDRSGIVHIILGKASFEGQMLLENMTSVVDAIIRSKPTGAKGQYIKSAYLATTMGPGVRLDLRAVSAMGGV